MKILKFGAVWCPACLIMRSRWKQIEEEFNIETNEYDYDIDTDLVEKYNIGKVLPVVIILDEDEKEIDRIVGEVSTQKIKEIIEKCREM